MLRSYRGERVVDADSVRVGIGGNGGTSEVRGRRGRGEAEARTIGLRGWNDV